MTQAESSAPNCVLLLILLGLLGMAATTGNKVVQTFAKAPPHAAAPADNPAPAEANDPSLALSQDQADAMSALMRKLQGNPNDADALMEIADIFLNAKEWARAEVFLTRAVLSRPGDARPRYMLGLSQYQAGKMPEAALSFEELLSLKEDPAAMYNLAVIYKYHLNKKDDAQALLTRILDSASADMDTLDRARKELE